MSTKRVRRSWIGSIWQNATAQPTYHVLKPEGEHEEVAGLFSGEAGFDGELLAAGRWRLSVPSIPMWVAQRALLVRSSGPPGCRRTPAPARRAADYLRRDFWSGYAYLYRLMPSRAWRSSDQFPAESGLAGVVSVGIGMACSIVYGVTQQRRSGLRTDSVRPQRAGICASICAGL